MMKDVLVYISGPITARNGVLIEENVAIGLKAFLQLTHLGIPSFSPQILGTFPSASLVSYRTWMEYDFAIINRCTHVLMLPKWKDSPGCAEELVYANERGIPILYSVTELVSLLKAEA